MTTQTFTANDVAAFAEMIRPYMTEGRAPIHAAQAAQENEANCFAKFFNSPSYRRAVVGTLVGTYDEILCETPSGCTCGAPASTPAGMHHCDCAVHPGWCRQEGCLPCERAGRIAPSAQP